MILVGGRWMLQVQDSDLLDHGACANFRTPSVRNRRARGKTLFKF